MSNNNEGFEEWWDNYYTVNNENLADNHPKGDVQMAWNHLTEKHSKEIKELTQAKANKRMVELLVTPLENHIKTLEADLENERRIAQKRITNLEALLVEACGYILEAKKKFAPNTTNSFVDDFLNKPEIKKLLEGVKGE